MNVCTFEPRIPDPVRTIDRTTGPRPIQHTNPHTGDYPRTDIGRTRPETQQNLIHTDKEQHDRHQDDRSNGVKTRVGRIAQAHIHTELEHSAIQTKSSSPGVPPESGGTGFHRLKTNQRFDALAHANETRGNDCRLARSVGLPPRLLCKRGWWRQSGSNR